MSTPPEHPLSFQPRYLTVFDTEYREDGREPVCVAWETYELDKAGAHAPAFFGAIGWEELSARESAPWPTGSDAVSVAFSGHGDLSAMRALGWPMPELYFDLRVELIHLVNGSANEPISKSLLGLCRHFGLKVDDSADSHKAAMQAAILEHRDHEHREAVLAYCLEDVRLAAQLLLATLPALLNWSQAGYYDLCYRGEVLKVVSKMEERGLPVDTELLDKVREQWPAVVALAKEQANRAFGADIFVGGVFKHANFHRWLESVGLLPVWPKTERGLPSTTEAATELFKDSVPAIRALRETWKLVKQGSHGLRLRVGPDGRARCWLNPLATATGRNAPKDGTSAGTVKGRREPEAFLFAMAKWVRYLMRPEPGKALLYCDWKSQEFFLQGYLSGDVAMQAMYAESDPYTAYGLATGLMPPGSTKKTCPEGRKLAKVSLLSLAYGMGEHTLAARAGISVGDACRLVKLYRETFHRYAKYCWRVNVTASAKGVLHNPLGWKWRVHGLAKATAVMNFPVQSSGAAMLWTALRLMDEADIRLVASVHDAVIIECEAAQVEQVKAQVVALMEQASQDITGADKPCRVDVKAVVWPDRYREDDPTEKSRPNDEMFNLVCRAVGYPSELDDSIGNSESVSALTSQPELVS